MGLRHAHAWAQNVVPRPAHGPRRATLRPAVSTTHERVSTLDGMRGIAALAVMASHYTSHRLFGGAVLAVDLLFCLGGFAIALSYQARLYNGSMSARDFFFKRLIRLYPMFQLGIVVGALCLAGKVAAGQCSLDSTSALNAVLLNTFDLPYFGNYTLHLGADVLPDRLFPANVPAWSLFFQLITNAVFALWVLRRWKSGPLLPALIAGASLVAYVAGTHQTNFGWEANYFFGGFPRALFGVFAGACLYLGLGAIRRRMPVVPAPLLLLLLLALLCYNPQWPRFNGVYWLAITLVVMPLLVAAGIVARAQNAALRRALAYLGWISYPLYCLHFPVLMAYTLATNNAPLGAADQLACGALALAVAHLAARYVDAPLRDWLTRAAFGGASEAAPASLAARPGRD